MKSRGLLIAVFGGILISCSPSTEFGEDLAKAVAASEKIVLKEQSHWTDFHDSYTSPAPVFEYRSYELSSEERSQLIKALSELGSRPWVRHLPPAEFGHHHSISLFQGEKLTSEVLIAFGVFGIGDIRWYDTDEDVPEGLQEILAAVFEGAGFEIKRSGAEWKEMAKKASEQHAAGDP